MFSSLSVPSPYTVLPGSATPQRRKAPPKRGPSPTFSILVACELSSPGSTPTRRAGRYRLSRCRTAPLCWASRSLARVRAAGVPPREHDGGSSVESLIAGPAEPTLMGAVTCVLAESPGHRGNVRPLNGMLAVFFVWATALGVVDVPHDPCPSVVVATTLPDRLLAVNYPVETKRKRVPADPVG